MEFKIRKAEEKDALVLNNLLTKLIQDERQYDKNIDESFVVTSFYEHYVDDPNRCLLVADNNGVILGYLYGYLCPQEDGLVKHLEAKLDALFVEEEYRNNKIAQELIANFKSWCLDKKVNSIEVDVCSDNKKAFNLYSQSGFKEVKKSLKMDI